MQNDMNKLEISPEIQDRRHEDPEVSDRREFLKSLGKWSTAAIAAIVPSESLPANDATGWVNRRGEWRRATAGLIGSTAAARG